MSRTVALPIVAAVAVIACIRIAMTHGVFSPTWDEPAHVSAGWDYIVQHKIFLTEHPPIARAVAAFPLRHARVVPGGPEAYVQIYESAGDYMKGAVKSRRAVLIFTVIGIFAVAWWAWELFGPVVGVAAAMCFSLLPPVLAHAGLATTDMAVTAAFPLAMAVCTRWLRTPTWPWTIALGFAVALGLSVKFSFPVFFGLGAIVLAIAMRRLPVVKAFVAALLAFVLLWQVVYRGEHGRLYKVSPRAPMLAADLFGSKWFAREVRLPMPRYFVGLLELKHHDKWGHAAYFLGRTPQHGTWYYFPVVLAIKTPIPFLLLAAAGIWFVFRDRNGRHVVAITAAMLAVAMTSHLNLGVRYILPIYAPLSLLAGLAAVRLWSWLPGRAGVAATALWLVINSFAAHPDYLPWMNAFAGKHPEDVVLDSNFDWGQDELRLRDECRRLRIASLGVDLFGFNDLNHLGFPPTHPIDRHAAASGWFAISENNLHFAQVEDRNAYRWLTDPFRFRRVGKSIRLYYVP